MSGIKQLIWITVPLILLLISAEKLMCQKNDCDEAIVQAQISLTVSESKRLIAKAVAMMPIVKKALKHGMIIITRGTTNTYVAEEILGRSIERGAFVTGRIYPQKGGKKLNPSTKLSEIILVNGERVEKLSYSEAVKNLKAGDVVIKGANALDYKNKIAGVYIGSPTGGTTGKFLPYVVARKAYLIIPIGLEKLIAGDIIELSKKMRSSVVSLNKIPSMFSLTGEIVTEIEALKILTRVSAFQAGAGGIGGAEGGVKLIARGSKNQVDKALKIIEGIYGEPPFVE
jgi:hypothetical protein